MPLVSLLGVGEVQHIFQCFVLVPDCPARSSAPVRASAGDAPDAVCCSFAIAGTLLLCSFPIIVPILHRELKALGKNSFDPGRFRVDLQPWLYYYKGIF